MSLFNMKEGMCKLAEKQVRGTIHRHFQMELTPLGGIRSNHKKEYSFYLSQVRIAMEHNFCRVCIVVIVRSEAEKRSLPEKFGIDPDWVMALDPRYRLASSTRYILPRITRTIRAVTSWGPTATSFQPHATHSDSTATHALGAQPAPRFLTSLARPGPSIPSPQHGPTGSHYQRRRKPSRPMVQDAFFRNPIPLMGAASSPYRLAAP